MPRWLARQLGWGNAQGLALFLQAILFGFALSAHSGKAWFSVFSLAALINLWSWVEALRWYRAMVDTPTSRIASAAQGFVELLGVGHPLPDRPLLSPFTHLPCLWYRYSLERRRNGEWRQAEQGESEQPFLLDDASGRCEIDPEDAQVITAHKEIRTQGDERYTEYLLLKGDRLYALGDFVSFSGEQISLDQRIDVGNLLADWKADQSELRQRFDLDRNGAIDDTEWQQARRAAEQEIERRHRDIRSTPTQHRLQKPNGRKPYLIANHPPEKLGRRYFWFSLVYLTLLLSCLVGIAWSARLPG